MTTSLENLEVARGFHADIERHHLEIVKELHDHSQVQTQKQKIIHDHYIQQKLDAINEKQKQLLQLYEAEDFKMLGQDAPSKVVSSFYARLAELREYHRRFHQEVKPKEEDAMDETAADATTVNFTAEERYGKYLDLHALYMEYINLSFNFDDPSQPDGASGAKPSVPVRRQVIDYSAFLQRLGYFHTIARKYKNDSYRTFLQNLCDYLVDFFKRTRPLENVAPILAAAAEELNAKWQEGTILGWEDMKDQEKIDPEKKEGKLTKKQRRLLFYSKVILLELQVKSLLDTLKDVLERTVDYVERKHTINREEFERELEQEEEDTERAFEKKEEVPEPDDAAPRIHDNPLNLPPGLDGKPIPYWLYKLHGLGLEYKCEICANHVYNGPRAFERHFQEWRHAQGMRCLRIPNTRHFHHVTKINDAIALWEKIKYESSMRQFRAEAEQEFEDHDGHVLTKKSYEDLRRQGYL
eukprot:TRINITY_DN55485_c0_g1_i1.p1 TRINITY_DN55485_c0_g1~~TRINITY_DN55485_c0_g1_i1.p1  ORF type:complete len:468 (-),score=143.25 TRINITY_DN55485_c0_g1_i1:57-1460(-)